MVSTVLWMNIDLANTNPGSHGWGWANVTRQQARDRKARHLQENLAGLSVPFKLVRRDAQVKEVESRWERQSDFGTAQVWLVMKSGADEAEYVHWFVTREQAVGFKEHSKDSELCEPVRCEVMGRR